MARIDLIRSRDNPRYKALRRLVQHSGGYRQGGVVWIEGEHLCDSLLARGIAPREAVLAESVHARLAPSSPWLRLDLMVLPDGLMDSLSALDSPARQALVVPLPAPVAPDALAPSVVLDRLQDPGNVGSILRSAAAFGVRQVIALTGTVGLWSPKVLRAGMGAHFGLSLIEGRQADDLQALRVPLLVTSSHQGDWLHEVPPPVPCAWVMGHEGQGVSPALQALAARSVRIAQPGGEESLNVAAAAAICLHASAVAMLKA